MIAAPGPADQQAAADQPDGRPPGSARPGDCPACVAAQAAAAALLQQLSATDREEAGFPWGGICNSHAWQLAAYAVAARRLAEARLHATVERLSAASDAGGGRHGRRERLAIRPEGDCPFCAAMTAAAAAALDAQLENETGEDAPWCVPHLTDALGRIRGRDRVRAVARRASAHFAALEADLSELIRKSDYRFRGEPRGAEASSWTRAATLVAGSAGVHWTLRRDPEIEG